MPFVFRFIIPAIILIYSLSAYSLTTEYPALKKFVVNGQQYNDPLDACIAYNINSINTRPSSSPNYYDCQGNQWLYYTWMIAKVSFVYYCDPGDNLEGAICVHTLTDCPSGQIPGSDNQCINDPIGSDSPCSPGQVDLAPDISGNQCGPPPTCSAGFKLNDAGNLCVADGSACVATANSSCPSPTGKPHCSAGFIPDPSGGPGCVAGNGSACVATPTMGCPDTGAGTTGGTGSGTGTGTGTGTGSGTGDTGGGNHDGGGDDNSTCPAGMIPGPGGCQVGTDDPADCPFGTSLSGGVCTVNSGGDGGVGTGSGTGDGGVGTGSGTGGAVGTGGGGSSGTGTGSGGGGSSGTGTGGSGTGSDDPCPSDCPLGVATNCYSNDCPSPQVDIDPLAAGPQCGLSSQRVLCSTGTGSGSGGTGTGTGSGDGIPTDYARDSTVSNAVSNLSGKLTDIKSSIDTLSSGKLAEIKSSIDNLSSGKLTEIKSSLDGISNAVTNKTGGSPSSWSHETRSSPGPPDESVRIADLRAQIASKIASIRSDVGVMFASSMPVSGYACNRGFVVFGVSYPLCFDKYLDLFSYIGTGIMFIAWVIVFMVILK